MQAYRIVAYTLNVAMPEYTFSIIIFIHCIISVLVTIVLAEKKDN